MDTMPRSVLQPVHRRRRRRRRARGPAVMLTLLLVALVATGSVAAARHYFDSAPAAAPAPAVPSPRLADGPMRPLRPRVPVAAQPAPTPRLVTGAPAIHHRFDPALSGNAAILIDADTGRVLWALHPHLKRRIASTTKVMTATLALERLRPTSIVRVSPQAPRVYPNREGLRPRERVPAWKLFYGLLLYSGNDDALALAIASAGSRPAFVAAMNAKARELGMRGTHFSAPSGVVDRDNYSTAWDMAILARYAMQNPRFRQVVHTPRKSVPWAAPTFGKIYVNTNRLLTTYPGADGIKTGWTTIARHCLVASATRHGRRLIVVVLHSEDAFADATRLLNLGFRTRG